MTGRDPGEQHRVASNLELIFDLTFAAAFSIASSQLAHALAGGHWTTALAGYTLAMFGTCWAWVNFSWFASAYDTDDWAYRLTTMLQMVGVIVFALGIPPMFASLEHGAVNNHVMVAGYVVMRLAMIVHWLRAARQDPQRRGACLIYARTIAVAQVGWVALASAATGLAVTAACMAALALIELAGPVFAERRAATPWHAHHIAERYGLLAVIALGEGIAGTIAAVSAVVAADGWSWQAGCLVTAGTGLTFGMWWAYTTMPSAEVLHIARGKSFVWGYGHILVFGSIVATGAGLHVAAYKLQHQAELSDTAAVLTTVVPVGLFLLMLYGLYYWLLPGWEPLHGLLAALTVVILLGCGLLAAAGVAMPVCLLVLTLATLPTIIGYEYRGHRHQHAAVTRLAGHAGELP
jgi:low temperature requirement protein LtrA